MDVPHFEEIGYDPDMRGLAGLRLSMGFRRWILCTRSFTKVVLVLCTFICMSSAGRLHADPGDFMSIFASGGGLARPRGLVFGPDGNLYVSSSHSSKVLRYDGTTGAFIDVFASAVGLNHFNGLVFGPDSNLYVAAVGTSEVLRFDGTSGAFLDVFATGGGLDSPQHLVFGPDGNLYVSCATTDQVLRYHGATGLFMDVFASGGGLDAPFGIIFGPDGNLYVSSGSTDEILKYDGSTGAFIGPFATAPKLDLPRGLVFGPDANLYVSSSQFGEVLRFDGATGAFIEVFTNGGNLSLPQSLVFGPDTNLYVSNFDNHEVVRFEGLGIGTSYCASSANSTGSPALISAMGSPSVAINDLTLVARPVPDLPGIFFLGVSQIQAPFGNGTLCVSGGVKRILPATVAAGNVARKVVDLNALGILPGAVNFQYWFRDPAAGGSNFDLSDALQVVFTP